MSGVCARRHADTGRRYAPTVLRLRYQSSFDLRDPTCANCKGTGICPTCGGAGLLLNDGSVYAGLGAKGGRLRLALTSAVVLMLLGTAYCGYAQRKYVPLAIAATNTFQSEVRTSAGRSSFISNRTVCVVLGIIDAGHDLQTLSACIRRKCWDRDSLHWPVMVGESIRNSNGTRITPSTFNAEMRKWADAGKRSRGASLAERRYRLHLERDQQPAVNRLIYSSIRRFNAKAISASSTCRAGLDCDENTCRTMPCRSITNVTRPGITPNVFFTP